MKKTTIKDIAKALNVNQSTISRGLKKHPDISEAMQKRIEEAATLMNYHPNQIAVNFRSSHSKLIGLILPDIGMYYFPEVIKAVMTETQKKGFHILMLQSGENLEREVANVAICQMMNVEGVLASVTKNTKDGTHFSTLEANGIPVVFWDKTPPVAVNFSVTFDDISAAQTAVGYLIRCGAKKIIGVLGNENLSITKKRQQGMENMLAEQVAKKKNTSIIYANNAEEAYQKVKAICHKFDGFFCMSDEVLSGTMRALYVKHISIPHKAQVVAISDGVLPYLFNPTVTYVESSGYMTGQLASLELLRLMDDPLVPAPRHIIQQTPLIINGSTHTS
ncbi:MAG: LacI family DNA-binding transcriptional regulator [Saprospiraceae bacterium]|nr:LacI family DNA-binding transcriptional regulator [Saprospiraceae bacterium]MBP7699003.1 LacI family DNA-binding transcriptional regulator [Saprospiraceae bacterium]